jgi:hypothetical protein
MKNYTNAVMALLLIMATTFYSCEQIDDINKDIPENPADSSNTVGGKVTDIGTPVGVAESTVIGASGGSLSTADARLKIEVPEGAFTSDQTVVIQPITNNNEPGKGLAYRISPHDITFAKPVKITFNYTEEDIKTSFPEALSIAYQDKKQVWQGIGVSKLDTTNQSVSIYTTHFSDWSLFTSLDLFPPTSIANPGETIELELVGYFDEDLLVPIAAGQEAPIMGKRAVSKYAKEWTLAGSGILKPNGPKATYTAPSQIPAVNPVAVTLELDLKQKGKFFLVRNIFIGRAGIYLKLDNNEYFHMDGEVRYLAPANMTMLTGGTVVEGQTRGISIHWEGKISMQSFHWTTKLPLFNYNYEGRYMYLHYFEQEISPGKLTITGYGEAGGYVTGKFYLEAAGLLDGQAPAGQYPWLRKGKIEGYFMVKRVN